MERFTVLIVDDEEDFVDTMVRRLRAKGLEVDGVTRGSEAIERLNEKDYDVCILDVKMPGMDGIETLREMKKKNMKMELL